MATEIFEDPSGSAQYQSLKYDMSTGKVAGCFGGTPMGSAILGGKMTTTPPWSNCVCADYSVVLMGTNNTMNTSPGSGNGCQNVILNGDNNVLCGVNIFIGGGCYNSANHGSWLSIINGCCSTIAVGASNVSCNIVDHGGGNQISKGCFINMGTGQNNCIDIVGIMMDSCFAGIASGYENCLCGQYSDIINGYNQCVVCSNFGFIGSGCMNTIAANAGCFTFIGTGSNHNLGDCFSFIGSGCSHDLVSPYTFIGVGKTNVATGLSTYSAIFGGNNHNVVCAYGVIGGGNNNAILSTQASTIFGGENNQVCDQCSLIFGGLKNCNSAGFGVVRPL